jgi:hypothetical protein
VGDSSVARVKPGEDLSEEEMKHIAGGSKREKLAA